MDFPGEKLVIKLWETLAEKGIGSLLSPWQATREGKARNVLRREELLLLAQAEVDAADIRAGRKRLEKNGSLRLLVNDAAANNVTDQAERVEPTLRIPYFAEASLRNSASDGVRREINTSKAIIYAEETLSGDAQIPPNRSIDDDWLFTWRDNAGKVSTENLQQLWGKVLAGEVKSPGSYSLRTLEFLRGLSKEEAEQISKVATFVVEDRIVRSLKQYLEEQGISFGILLAMRELGLLLGVEATGLKTSYKSSVTERFVRGLRSNGKVLVVKHEDPNKVFDLKVYSLTTVGSQLLGLGSFTPNLDYLRLCGKEIVKQGFDVYLADWVQTSEKEGQYSNEDKIDA
jgi:hypothetical protein